MRTGSNEQEWLVGGCEDRILWKEDVLPRLMEEMHAGYRRYAWGGVEIGGYFVGSRRENEVCVQDFVLATCSHEHGPSFGLSKNDKVHLRESLLLVRRDGLEGVGYFHSVSNRQELLNPADEALFAELFPERRQFALVIRRAKEGEPVPTLFVGSGGRLVKEVYAIAPAWGVDTPANRGAEGIADPEVPEPTLAERKDGGAVAPPVPDLAPEADPFTLTPNPSLFYPSKQHRDAMEGLWNGIRTRKGFLLLSGESGMGKTMVLECLTDRLKRDNIEYGFVLNSRLAAGDLFEMLRVDFGLETDRPGKTSVLIALNNLLLKLAAEGRTVALLVDDAHQLSTDVLEEIELLSNLETRHGKLLQVVFAARPEFELRLGEESLRGLRTRMMRRFRLGPLTEEETAGYIGVRLRQRKLGNILVPEGLFGEIHRRTGGVPRMITALCGAAVERCEETHAESVDMELLERVASEFGL